MCTRTAALRIHHWATVSPSHCANMVVQHAWRQRLVVHTAHVHLATRPFRRAIRFACTSAVGQARWKICWRYALCFGAHASAWLTPCVPWQGYLISLSMDHGHDTMIDVTSATSLAQVHTLIQEALNTQHNVVGLSFCELGKEVRTACLVDLIPLSSNSDAGCAYCAVCVSVVAGAAVPQLVLPAPQPRAHLHARTGIRRPRGGRTAASAPGRCCIITR